MSGAQISPVPVLLIVPPFENLLQAMLREVFALQHAQIEIGTEEQA